MSLPINQRIKWGWLPDGYEIAPRDIGETIDLIQFGKVQRSDVGRKVYIRDGKTYLKSQGQVIKRRGGEYMAQFCTKAEGETE